jgi:hypothetical protein
MARLPVSVTDPIEHNYTWNGKSLVPTQEIPRVLWNLNVYYDVRKSPPRVAILSNMSLVDTLPS